MQNGHDALQYGCMHIESTNMSQLVQQQPLQLVGRQRGADSSRQQDARSEESPGGWPSDFWTFQKPNGTTTSTVAAECLDVDGPPTGFDCTSPPHDANETEMSRGETRD